MSTPSHGPGRTALKLAATLGLSLPLLAPTAAAERSGERPSRFSPAALAERHAELAGRSAIPQPGEGFPEPLAAPTEAPVQIPFAVEGEVVPWDEAAAYLGGDTITVEGDVEEGFQIPNGPVLLKFDAKDRSKFYLAVFSRDWTGEAAPAERLYQGKKIRVTGLVEDYRGTPQMKVERPDQIEIVGM